MNTVRSIRVSWSLYAQAERCY